MFQRFLWEAWQDLTLIILIIAAAVSLALGIKTEVQSAFIIAKIFKMNLPGLIWFEQISFIWRIVIQGKKQRDAVTVTNEHT